MTPPKRSERLAFSSFQLDLRSGRLLRGGKAVALRPKTWAVLMYLAERPGALVTKDELLDAVWPDVAVTPDTLTKSIGELREALDDDSKAPRSIETVHRRGFRFIAQPEVETPADVEWRIDAPSELVGREGELRQLQRLLEESEATGRRRMALVTGAAGIGKTALVNAFLQSIADHSRTVLIGHGTCIEQFATPEPYMPVLDAIEGMARGSMGPAVRDDLRRVAPTWLAQLPWLSGEPAESLQPATPGPRSDHMLREFAALTEALSKPTPLVLVLEDLHWGDPSTVDLLSFLGGRREPARLLIIGTYRRAEVAVGDHPLGRAARTLGLRQQASDIALHELSSEDVRLYLQSRFPAAPFVTELARVVHDYTDGNPLLVVAVIDHLVARGSILETSPGWALVVAPTQEALPIPDEARNLFQMQLESLSPAERAVVEAASVAGREFAIPTLAAAIRVPAEQVEESCEALARGHRLLRTAQAALSLSGDEAPERRYAFIHELYRKASYGQLDAGRRQRLHLRIGEALEAAAGDRADSIAAELATHFRGSGDPAREVRYLAIAAATARRRFANREATGFLRSAITAAAHLPADRRKPAELSLRIQLSAPLADLAGYTSRQVLENAERARALCNDVGDDIQLFQVVYGLVHVRAARADAGVTEALAAEMDAVARRLGSPGHRLLADSALLRVAFNGGECVEACRLGEQISAAHRSDRAHELTGFGPDPVISARAQYAVALWMLGRSAESRAVIATVLAAVDHNESPFTVACAMCFAAMHAVLLRSPEDAFAYAERGLEVADEHGLTQWIGPCLGYRGWARTDRGEPAQGIAELEQAREAMRSTHLLTCFGSIASFLAEAHYRVGATAAGLAVADDGLAVAESTRDHLFWPDLWRIKGELLLAADVASEATRRRRRRGTAEDLRWRDAEQYILHAVELAAATGKRALALRGATSLARAWQAAGRATEARLVLEQHCGGLVDPHNRDLQDAEALLADLARTAPSAVGGSE